MHPNAEPNDPFVEEDEDEASLQSLVISFLGAIRRHWKLALTVWLLTVIPVGAYAVTAVPEYTASGAVQVSEGSAFGGANPLLELAGGGGAQAEVQTEVEILKRREFIVDALQRLRLQVADADAPGAVTTDLDVAIGGESPVDPTLRHVREVTESATIPSGRFETAIVELSMGEDGNIIAAIGEDEPETVTFAPGQALEHEAVHLKFREAPLEPGQSITLAILPEGALLERYRPLIGVTGLGTIREPTNIVQISTTHPDRETARAIVQTMLEQYLAKTLQWQSQSASQSAEFIEGQLEDVRTNLKDAEDKMLAFSQENNAIQLDTQAEVAIENAAELEAQRVEIQLQERTIGTVLRRIQSGRSPRASLTANFFDDPVLATSIAGLTEAETKYETMRASLTPDHPQVQQLHRALELQRQEVARLMKSAQRNLSSQKRQIDAELEKSTEAMSAYPDRQLELARITRDMEVSQRLYSMLLEKLEEAEILKASTTTDKRIVDNASLPHEKTSPRRGRLLGFGAIGGLMLGIGMAFGAHLLQRRLDTVEAVREVAPYPTYGTVPEVAEAGGASGAERLTVRNVWARPHESLPESFRALGVSVTLIPGHSERGKLLTVTSSQPGEGKSTVASNLAESLGRTGKKVLLVDLDLRKPVQHRLWGVARQPGYSDLVGQGGKAEDVTRIAHDLEDHNTTVLTAGTRLPDTVAAIMAPSLEHMFDQWVEHFDYVIIDSPPAFVAETVAITRHADLVLLVARPGVIERQNLRHAIEALERVDVPKGLVLNAVGRKHTEYYYGSGYYYYGSRYGEDDDSAGKGRAAAG